MRGEITRGAAWMVLFRLCDRSVGVVSTTLLARLLLPADFGLVAMAMSVIALIEMATSFSFEIALIQKSDPEREHYDTAWTLNILCAAGGACVTASLAHPVASFYADPRLVAVLWAIAAAWLVSGFENVATVNFRRRMDFAAEFRFMAAKRLIAFVVTMAAALAFRSYWALIVGMATGRLAGVALSYVMEPFRPRWSLARSRDLFSFSGWLQANKLAGAILSKTPHFFVGRIFGAQNLGAYSVGSEISQLAHTELVAPINRAMFPGYARLVGDRPLFRRTCIEATAAILLIVLPVSVFVAVLAEPMVRVLLGAQWADAVPVVQVLAFAGAVSALTSNNVTAYLALGRPHLSTVIVSARLLVLAAAALIVVSGQGMVSVAYAELIAALASLLVSLPILFAAIELRVGDYLATLWRPLIGSAAMGAGIGLLEHAIGRDGSFGNATLQLAAGVPVGLVLYAFFVWVMWLCSGRRDSVESLAARRLLAFAAAALRRGR
jgi:O-antigen/teichoic acid export membrane protein